MGRTRELLTRVGVAAAVVAMLGACSVSTSSNGSNGGSGKISGQVNVAVVNNPDMVRMQKLSKHFTEETGVKVNFVVLPDQDLRQKVTAAASTKSGLYDVVMISPVEVQSGWAANKWIQPLNDKFSALPQKEQDDYDVKDLIPAVADSLSVDGKLYSLPFYGESNITYYRKDLFDKAGITMPDRPTWTDIAAAAKKLNDPGNGVYGIALKGIPQYGQLAPLMTEVNSYGAAWFDENWNPQFTSPEFKKAVTDYVNLVKTAGEPGPASVGFVEGLNLMSQGKAAIWVDATVAAGALADPKTSKVVGKIGYAAAPTEGCDKGSHWLYAWSLSLVSGAKNPDAAFAFMRWATSRGYIQLVADTDGWENIPPGTRTSTYKNENYLKVAPFAPVTLDAMNTATNNEPSCKSVPYRGTTSIYIPEWSDIGQNFAQGLAAAVSGKTTVDQWLNRSQAYATKVMTDAGYIK
jgi:sorbitol/mannitol transport system substrate-binding protein